jgi:hypothetical protein
MDTARLAQTLTIIPNDNHISKQLLVKAVLDYEYTHVVKMLTRPKPWTGCTELGKSLYQKMLDWSQSENKIKSLKALHDQRNEKANHLGLPNLTKKPLDTVEVSQTILAFLKSRDISLNLFGKKVIENGVWGNSWQKLFTSPSPWE